MSLQLYHALSQINKICRKELVLPIAKCEVVVSPLSVGDDLMIKTALMSPAKLDKELLRMLWMHTEFWIPSQKSHSEIKNSLQQPISTSTVNNQNSDENQNISKSSDDLSSDATSGSFQKIKEQDFYNKISYFDKLVLLWGIYNVTYNNLGEQDFICPNEKCKHEFRDTIYIDETMHEDSLTIFEHDEPFNKYNEVFTIPLNNDYMLEFTIRIPTMADSNMVLGLLSTEEIQKNLETIKTHFNTEQLMALYIKKMAVYKKDKPDEKIESFITKEIISSLRDFINIDISTAFFKEYTDRFSKYAVNFYKKCKCPACGHEFNVNVDMEYHFFRRQLFS